MRRKVLFSVVLEREQALWIRTIPLLLLLAVELGSQTVVLREHVTASISLPSRAFTQECVFRIDSRSELSPSNHRPLFTIGLLIFLIAGMARMTVSL